MVMLIVNYIMPRWKTYKYITGKFSLRWIPLLSIFDDETIPTSCLCFAIEGFLALTVDLKLSDRIPANAKLLEETRRKKRIEENIKLQKNFMIFIEEYGKLFL